MVVLKGNSGTTQNSAGIYKHRVANYSVDKRANVALRNS